MPTVSGIESKLPVFTTPQQQIVFYADDPSSHKQILTVYNPYDFDVKFRILCTDCSKYTVSAAQGYIKSNYSIDIVIHHKAVIPSNIGVSDTVRVHLYASGQIPSGGKKEISIILLPTLPREKAREAPTEAETFQQLETDTAALGHLRQQPFVERNSSHVFFIWATLIVCIALLAIPKEGDENDFLPKYIPRPPPEYKLYIAFFLGILFTLLCRT